MQFLLSTETKRQINLLYGNRLHYLTNNSFCPSFIDFLERISRDFDSLLFGSVKYRIINGYRYTELTAVAITYKLLDIGVIVIHDIGFIGLGLLKKRCMYDRRVAHTTLGKRPNHIKPSASLSDYRATYFKGGEINGIPVKIVQRINMASMSNKPLFNYLYNGRLLSRYDMLNLTPFTIQKDGELKAYGDAVNGKRYWIYPNGKWRLLREGINNQVQKIRLTEAQFKEILIECITKIIKEIA